MTTPTTVSVRLQLRADTAANWTSANPTLLANELGRETDTGKIKIGNGSTAWSSLAYQAWATLPIAVASGGTGQTSYTNGQLLIGNTTGNTLTKATLTAGSGIAITNGTGSITVAASGISDAQIAADAEIAVSKLADGAARQLLQTDAAGTGVEWASNIDIPGTLDVTSTATFDSIASHPLGAAATPSITFTGDLNTGIYSPGADQVAISTNGTNRFQIDSSGNITVDTNTFYVDAANNRVGIGTTSPSASLTIVGATGSLIDTTKTSVSTFFAGGDGSTFSAFGTSTNHPLAIYTNSQRRVDIDSSGRLLVGTSSARTAAGITSPFQVEGSGVYDNYCVNIIANSNVGAAEAPALIFGRSRGTSNGSVTAVQNGDRLGSIAWTGANGSNLSNLGGLIECYIDGAVSGGGANDMPGRLVFSTTADGAGSPTERMRITSTGYLKASNTGTYNDASSAGTYHELMNNVTTLPVVTISARTASFGSDVISQGCFRAANTAWSCARFFSGNGTTDGYNDTEFNFRGDGNAFADGSWTGGGADYAEYFEWSDGNPDADDRRGISVVLDGDKIREAVAGEDPIGVISGNPSVVGDAAWNKWSGKYLRDEFGTYILEDYEVTDDDGNTVMQQRRKLNPAYDPDVEYIPREQRPEWDCVGLMGKLRIRKGQITGSRWIKMRDISDLVEEWLVR